MLQNYPSVEVHTVLERAYDIRARHGLETAPELPGTPRGQSTPTAGAGGRSLASRLAAAPAAAAVRATEVGDWLSRRVRPPTALLSTASAVGARLAGWVPWGGPAASPESPSPTPPPRRTSIPLVSAGGSGPPAPLPL